MGLDRPIPALATFHPAYLLRTPGQKREAWCDFLNIKKKLIDFTK
jgi:uracil-DNA glycosylase family 4